jgi:hypothetical protein
MNNINDTIGCVNHDCDKCKAVQEPVAWGDLLKKAEEVVRSKPLWKKYIDGTPLANDIAVWMASFAQAHTTPPAAQPAVQEGRDWSLLAATQESLREHMAEIKRLKAAQPAPVKTYHDGKPWPVQPVPHECQTEAEKTAYAFGWWKAMEYVREHGVIK